MTLLVVLLGVAVGLLSLLVIGLLRSHAEVLRALHGMGAGIHGERAEAAGPQPVSAPGRRDPVRGNTVAGVPDGRSTDSTEAPPALVGVTPHGETARVAVAGNRAMTLLAFLSSGCVTCAGFWDELAQPEARAAAGGRTRVVIVTKGPEEESISRVAELAPPGLDVILSSEAWDDYGVVGSPYFVLVDGSDGVIVGEGAASSWGQITELLQKAAADRGYAIEGPTRRQLLGGRLREARADRELRAAGIEPGDPSLYPVEAPWDDARES